MKTDFRRPNHTRSRSRSLTLSHPTRQNKENTRHADAADAAIARAGDGHRPCSRREWRHGGGWAAAAACRQPGQLSPPRRRTRRTRCRAHPPPRCAGCGRGRAVQGAGRETAARGAPCRGVARGGVSGHRGGNHLSMPTASGANPLPRTHTRPLDVRGPSNAHAQPQPTHSRPHFSENAPHAKNK